MLTWAEIDLNSISQNLRQIKGRCRRIMAIIKDNAYGHGAIEVAHTAAQIPVDMFGVAILEEAVELRQARINLPVLVLCCILPEQAPLVVENNITQTVCDREVCEALSREATKQGKKAKVHIKIDTGMGRIGVRYDEAIRFIKRLANLPNFIIDGIFTHFAAADNDPDFTNLQLERFKLVLLELEKASIHIPIKHAANSAAILSFPESYFDIVRPGLMTYGLYPGEASKTIDLKPALSLKTRVFYLKEVPSGWTISYDRTYTTKKTTLVASLAIGYGHGYTRRLSNKGEVLIRGKRSPIIGVVCMDQCLCDVTHIPGVAIGDEVVLIGRQGDETITADEVAEKSGTISYEVLCGINARVPRIYKT